MMRRGSLADASTTLADVTTRQQEIAVATALLASGALSPERPVRYRPPAVIEPADPTYMVECTHGMLLACDADRFAQADGRLLPAAELNGGTVPGYGKVLKVACLAADRRAA